jgi:hypothetical protein
MPVVHHASYRSFVENILKQAPPDLVAPAPVSPQTAARAARDRFHQRVMARVAKGATTREAISEESKTTPADAVAYLTHGSVSGHDGSRPLIRPTVPALPNAITALHDAARVVAQERQLNLRDALHVVQIERKDLVESYRAFHLTGH